MTEERTFAIIYPERKIVSEATIIGWANDHLADHPQDRETYGLENGPVKWFDAMQILSDAGKVTFTRRQP